LFGSLAGLLPIAVWTGTHDLLNPDARRLYAKAAADNVLVTLHEYEAMVHVWPLLRIPEAEQAIREITDFLQNPTGHHKGTAPVSRHAPAAAERSA
jgi:monoterpene epsilon-lactone hydrolase